MIKETSQNIPGIASAYFHLEHFINHIVYLPQHLSMKVVVLSQSGPAFITKVQADPLNVVDENRVLPYLKSVGVVDFNRDGLPDIVQSWNSTVLPW